MDSNYVKALNLCKKERHDDLLLATTVCAKYKPQSQLCTSSWKKVHKSSSKEATSNCSSAFEFCQSPTMK